MTWISHQDKRFFSAWHFRENFVNSLFPRPFFSGVGYLVRASHFPQGRVNELPVEQNSHQFFCQGRRVVWWDWVTTDPSVLVPVLSVPASTSRTLRSRPLLNPPNQSCDSECSQLLLLFTLSLDPKWPQGFHLELMWDGEEAMW